MDHWIWLLAEEHKLIFVKNMMLHVKDREDLYAPIRLGGLKPTPGIRIM
jgi:hypothetical protein